MTLIINKRTNFHKVIIAFSLNNVFVINFDKFIPDAGAGVVNGDDGMEVSPDGRPPAFPHETGYPTK